jgi:formylglycine-generating enzyme required for sulfatase activity
MADQSQRLWRNRVIHTVQPPDILFQPRKSARTGLGFSRRPDGFRWLITVRMLVIAALMSCLAACAGTAPPLRSALAPGHAYRDCRDCPEMVVVPAGAFVMGSPADEPARDPDEGPQRTITFARPFAISQLAVTRGQFAAFARATHRALRPGCYADFASHGTWGVVPGLTWQNPGYAQTDDDPVVCVNFDDIRAYLAWLNARSGGGYRLISEAEYEYGARAGASTRYPWGDTITHDQANYGAERCCHGMIAGHDRWEHTSPGGAFGTNAFGLSDMQGNVWEFVADCYTPTLDTVPADGRPVVTAPCEKRVIRGAGWDDPSNYVRTANRYKQLETLPGSVTGFRLSRPVD